MPTVTGMRYPEVLLFTRLIMYYHRVILPYLITGVIYILYVANGNNIWNLTPSPSAYILCIIMPCAHLVPDKQGQAQSLDLFNRLTHPVCQVRFVEMVCNGK